MSSYEKIVAKLLTQAKIRYQQEKSFKDLKSGLFRFDFYIPDLGGGRAIIEVDGEYHFHPIRGRALFLKTQGHDRRKNSYCLANNIPLYRIPYWEVKNLRSAADCFQKKFLVDSKWWNDNLEVPKR